MLFVLVEPCLDIDEGRFLFLVFAFSFDFCQSDREEDEYLFLKNLDSCILWKETRNVDVVSSHILKILKFDIIFYVHIQSRQGEGM